jgi:LPS-assembly lipoprotein
MNQFQRTSWPGLSGPPNFLAKGKWLARIERAMTLVCVLALCACGFRPLYGTLGNGPGAQVEFNSIYIEPIPNEVSGYELRNSLLSLLKGSDRVESMRYRLAVTVHEIREGVAIASDNATITRYGYTMQADYTLTDIHTNKEITKGQESVRAGYDVAASPYATEVTLQDTRRRASQSVAEHIRLDLGVYFARKP